MIFNKRIFFLLLFCVQISLSDSIPSWGDADIDRTYQNIYYNRPYNSDEELDRIIKKDSTIGIEVVKSLLASYDQHYEYRHPYWLIFQRNKYKTLRDTLFEIMVDDRRNADFIARAFNRSPNLYVDELIAKYPQYSSMQKAGSRILFALSSKKLDGKNRKKVIPFLQKVSQYGQHCNREDALEYLYTLFPQESKSFFFENLKNPIYNTSPDTMTSADSIGDFDYWNYERNEHKGEIHSLRYWFSKYSMEYGDSSFLPQYIENLNTSPARGGVEYAYRAINRWANDSIKELHFYRGLSDNLKLCLKHLDLVKSDRIKKRLQFTYKYSAEYPNEALQIATYLQEYDDITYDTEVMNILKKSRPHKPDKDPVGRAVLTLLFFPLLALGQSLLKCDYDYKDDWHKTEIYHYSLQKLKDAGYGAKISDDSLRQVLSTYAGFPEQVQLHAAYPTLLNGTMAEYFKITGELAENKGLSPNLFDDICLYYWYQTEEKRHEKALEKADDYFSKKYRYALYHVVSRSNIILDTSFYVRWMPSRNDCSRDEISTWHYLHQKALQWGIETSRDGLILKSLSRLHEMHHELMGNRRRFELDDDLRWQDDLADYVNSCCDENERLLFLQTSLHFPLDVTVGKLAPVLLGDPLIGKQTLSKEFFKNEHIGFTTDVDTLLEILRRYNPDSSYKHLTPDILLQLNGASDKVKEDITYESYLSLLAKVEGVSSIHALIEIYPELSLQYTSLQMRKEQVRRINELLGNEKFACNQAIQTEEYTIDEKWDLKEIKKRRYAFVKQLSLEGRYCREIDSVIGFTPELQTLIIDNAPLGWKLPKSLNSLNRLKRVVLKKSSAAPLKKVPICTLVTQLSIDNCKRFSISDITKNFPNLETLSIKGPVKYKKSFLHENVQELSLQNVEKCDLEKIIVSFPNLQILQLNDCNLSEMDRKTIRKLIDVDSLIIDSEVYRSE